LDLDDINFENDPLLQNTSKVYIVPLVQNGPADVTYDQNFMEEIVRKASANSQLNLATGYFNLTESFIEQILSGTARYRIMTTSEFGNGFYGSKGLSGNIPDIYTSIEKEFHDLIGKRQQDQRVRLYEYYKENWSKKNCFFFELIKNKE
jgi:CDP-diacylglycerol--glycerol-3-phosphate 3-phosphatidyltransferase